MGTVERLCVELLGQGQDDQGIVDRFPAETIAVRVFEASTPILNPTHLSVQWVPVAVASGTKRQGREAQSQRGRIWVPVKKNKIKETKPIASYARWLLAASAVNSINH